MCSTIWIGLNKENTSFVFFRKAVRKNTCAYVVNNKSPSWHWRQFLYFLFLICDNYSQIYHESSNIYFEPFFCLAVFMLRLLVVIIVIIIIKSVTWRVMASCHLLAGLPKLHFLWHGFCNLFWHSGVSYCSCMFFLINARPTFIHWMKCHAVQEECWLTLEDATDRLYRNVGNRLPIYAA